MSANKNAIPQDILKGWTVLAVDDTPASLEIISDVLSYYGAVVKTAANGKQGLLAAQKFKPNLIIADIAMPELDGWGMIEALQTDVHTRDIPVIALTAHAQRGDRELAISKGFLNFLVKPLDPLNFMNQVLVLLEAVPTLGDDIRRKMQNK
ncbi:MAG: response regulator [Chloroflexi bacterium]|nr:MAG: response regulator [Chloroflexota bacterium]